MGTLLAPDIVIELNGRPALSSADGDAVAMAALFDAYPDYHREIVSVVDGGDTAAIRWRMAGHAAARFGDRLPDLDVHGCSVVMARDGRITRAWLYSADGQIDAVLALAGAPPERPVSGGTGTPRADESEGACVLAGARRLEGEATPRRAVPRAGRRAPAPTGGREPVAPSVPWPWSRERGGQALRAGDAVP